MPRRVFIDCREYPSAAKCSLRISGTVAEVVPVAEAHAIEVHGHRKSPKLAREIRGILKAEPAGKRKSARRKKATR